MEEKFFIVTEKSRLRGEYLKYNENRHVVNELIKSFFDENGIESREYYASDDKLMIVPTKADEEKFGALLGADQGNGLRGFKANSKINKAWKQALKGADIKVISRPMVMLYFKAFSGKSSSRIFERNGVVYCSYQAPQVNVPEGFIEIKASEFYKIVESEEEQSA